jgi:type I restriction enzyme, S subunit
MQVVIPKTWETLNFTSLIIDKRIEKKKIKTSDYLEIGKIPIIDQGQDFISAFTNDTSLIYKGGLPVIIFGDHTLILKFIDFPFAIGADGTKIIHTNEEKSIPKFFYYAINSKNIQSEGYKRHFSKLCEQNFSIPPLPEQKQIASILSNIDDTIQKTTQIVEQAQHLKKGMMQKLLARGIGHTKFKKVKLLFGKKIEIPEEWELVKLDNICSMITDGAHNSPSPTKHGYYFASVENIKNSQIDIESCTKISKNDYEHLVKGNCQPKKGDVLFSKDGTIGLSFVFQQDTDLVLLSSIAIIRTNSSCDSFFCNYSLQSEFLKKHLYSFVGGTGLKRIILEDIRNYEFPLPPLPEQKQIASILSNIDTQIQKEKLHKLNLERLKKGLMQKLLTGQIRVKV